MDLLLLCVGLWASVALHELAHLFACLLLGGSAVAVGTGWPPLLVRARVGGVVLYVGRTEPLSGLMTPGDARVKGRASPLVSAAGPAANLAVLAVLLAFPPDVHPFVLGVLAFHNLSSFLDSAIPRRADGGNDGAHVLERLGGAPSDRSLRWYARLAELYDALGLHERARPYHLALALELAAHGLPAAARAHAAALDDADAPGAAVERALVAAWIAVAEDRYDDARERFDALLATEPDGYAGESARYGLAVAWSMTAQPGPAPRFVTEAPDPERAWLGHILELGQALRADDADRALSAAETLGALSWWGEMRLAEVLLRTGDLPRARARAVAAQTAAQRLLADLPPAQVEGARLAMAPLGEILQTAALRRPLAREVNPRDIP